MEEGRTLETYIPHPNSLPTEWVGTKTFILVVYYSILLMIFTRTLRY